MPDWVSASILIGGDVPRAILPQLLQAIDDEGVSTDWDGTPFSVENIAEGEPIELMAHEVAWGYFETIETFCIEHRIAFVRWSGGCAGSFEPERLVFTGSGKPASYLVTEADDLVFDLDAVRRLGSIDAIEAEAAAANFRPPALLISNGEPASIPVERIHG